MKVIRSDTLGYCFGVRDAIEKAEKALRENKNKKVYSLGPLIHNKIALDNLSKQGLILLGENDASLAEDNSVVIIRAHGVSPEILDILAKKNCEIVNATCTRVIASQRIAEKYAQDNFTVILAGDKNHGEVVGIAGYAKNHFVLVQNYDEAISLNISKNDKCVLLSQTTFSESEFDKIKQILLSKCPSMLVMNTICSATKQHQQALEKLAPKVEAIIVVGGKNSANTKRLFLTAKTICKNSILIEAANEIPKEYFNFNTVGITAGASTPDEVIDEVEKELIKKASNQTH